MIDKSCSSLSKTRQFYFIRKFCFSFLLNPYPVYLTYLQYLKSGQKIYPSISNNMVPHIFRSGFGSYFPHILVTYLDYIFLLVCGNFPLNLDMESFWNKL